MLTPGATPTKSISTIQILSQRTLNIVTDLIPEELKKDMNKFPEINWSEVARASIKQKLADLKFLRAFTSESDISYEDAEKLGVELSGLLSKHFKGE